MLMHGISFLFKYTGYSVPLHIFVKLCPFTKNFLLIEKLFYKTRGFAGYPPQAYSSFDEETQGHSLRARFFIKGCVAVSLQDLPFLQILCGNIKIQILVDLALHFNIFFLWGVSIIFLLGIF